MWAFKPFKDLIILLQVLQVNEFDVDFVAGDSAAADAVSSFDFISM